MEIPNNDNTYDLDLEVRDSAIEEVINQLDAKAKEGSEEASRILDDFVTRLREATARCASQKSQTSLPEHPVSITELPDVLPKISFAEITRFLNARYAFRLARADYELQRAALAYKLTVECEPEDQSRGAHYLISLDADGETIRIIDRRTGGPDEKLTDRR